MFSEVSLSYQWFPSSSAIINIMWLILESHSSQKIAVKRLNLFSQFDDYNHSIIILYACNIYSQYIESLLLFYL